MCVSSPDDVPATGTGTLIIQLEDVNDNAPTIEERSIRVCLLSQTRLNELLCATFNLSRVRLTTGQCCTLFTALL